MLAQRGAKAFLLVAIVALAPVAAFAADPPAKGDPVKTAAADQPAASKASARYRAMRRQAAARPRPCSFFACPFQHILGIGY